MEWGIPGRDPFNQNFQKSRSKTQWIGLVQPEKFRKNGSIFWGGPDFSRSDRLEFWLNGSRARSSAVGFFCFHALGGTKQKKPTPLERGPPLHVNRVLVTRFMEEMSYVFSFTFFSLPLIFTLHWWPLAFLILSPPLQNFHVVLPTKKCFYLSL